MLNASLKHEFFHEDESGLESDAINFFRNNGPCNMGKWTFSSQTHKNDPVCGGILWDLFVVLHSRYYPKKNQIDLINNHVSWLSGLTGSIDTIVDYGCGGSEAIQDHTLPILAKYKPSTYMPVDICSSFVEGACEIVRNNLNISNIIPDCRDFLKGAGPRVSGKKLGLFFGASTNFDDFPKGMSDIFAAFRRDMNQGDFLAISVDTNLDASSVEDSYNHPLHAQQIINLLYRLKRDLNISGDLDPLDWDYKLDVENLDMRGHKILLASHCIEAKRPQSFMIGREHISVAKGQRFIVDKSYKIALPMINAVAKMNDYEFVGNKFDHQEKMVLALYRAT